MSYDTLVTCAAAMERYASEMTQCSCVTNSNVPELAASSFIYTTGYLGDCYCSSKNRPGWWMEVMLTALYVRLYSMVLLRLLTIHALTVIRHQSVWSMEVPSVISPSLWTIAIRFRVDVD